MAAQSQPVTVHVSRIPSFVTQADVHRCLSQMEGCLSIKLMGMQPDGTQIAYAEFSTQELADKAVKAMQGWTGWGTPGLALRMLGAPSSLSSVPDNNISGVLMGKRQRDDYEPGEMIVPSPPRHSTEQPAKQARNVVPHMAVDPRRATPPLTAPADNPSVRVVVRNDANRAPFNNNNNNNPPANGVNPPAGGSMMDPRTLIDNLVQSGLAEQLISAVNQRQQEQQHKPPVNNPTSYEPVDPRMGAPPSTTSYQGTEPLRPGPMQSVARINVHPPMQSEQQSANYHADPYISSVEDVYAPPRQSVTFSAGPDGSTEWAPQSHFYEPEEPGPSVSAGNVLGGPCERLYVEGLPGDISRREVTHIFRPFGGFQSLKLVTKPSKRPPHNIHSFAFVSFVSTEAAADAASKLQGYPLDLEDPEAGALHVSFARDARPTGPPVDNRRPLRGGFHPLGQPLRGGRTGGSGRGRGGAPRGRGGRYGAYQMHTARLAAHEGSEEGK